MADDASAAVPASGQVPVPQSPAFRRTATEASLDLRPVFEMVARFEALDEAAALSRGELLAGRILKVSEEVGEAAQAYIGMTGRNPRKGISHSEADLAAELCDVVLSAIVALAAVEDSWTVRLQAHLVSVAARTSRATDGIAPPAGDGGRTTTASAP